MNCPKCGEEYHGRPSRCPACDTPLKRKKPPLLMRLPMQLLAWVLSLALIVALLATVLLTDLRILTSSGGIQTILSHLLTSEQAEPDPTIPPTNPGMASSGLVKLSNTSTYSNSGEYSVDENGNIIAPDGSIIGNIKDGQFPNDIQISTESTSSPDALSNFLYTALQDILGEEADVELEQVTHFIENSTVMDFLTEKVDAYMEDAINGTQNTVITAEEIMALIEENEELLEETFQVEITEEDKAEIYTQIDQTIAEEDLNNAIREGINSVMQEPVPGLDGMTVSELLAKLQEISQPKVLFGMYGLCAILIALICALNYYQPQRGLRTSASSCVTAGTLVSFPLAAVQLAPSILSNYLIGPVELLQVLGGIASALAPLHYGILVFGIVLLIVSFLWRPKYK